MDKIKLLERLNKKLYYSGKCNDYDENGDLISNLFNDATEMAQCVEDDCVIELTLKELKSIINDNSFTSNGTNYAINTMLNIAWIYDDETDIHYFYSLK